jgi:hypothetical protein
MLNHCLRAGAGAYMPGFIYAATAARKALRPGSRKAATFFNVAGYLQERFQDFDFEQF